MLLFSLAEAYRSIAVNIIFQLHTYVMHHINASTRTLPLETVTKSVKTGGTVAFAAADGDHDDFVVWFDQLILSNSDFSHSRSVDNSICSFSGFHSYTKRIIKYCRSVK